MPAINKASNPRSAIRRSGRCARQRRLLARHDSRVQSWLNLYPGSEKAMLSINGRGEIKGKPNLRLAFHYYHSFELRLNFPQCFPHSQLTKLHSYSHRRHRIPRYTPFFDL